MAEVKDKIVTVESLSVVKDAIDTYNEETYMTKSDPTGLGTLSMTGNGNFSGIVTVGSLKIGDAILEYDTADGVLKIEFSTIDDGVTE